MTEDARTGCGCVVAVVLLISAHHFWPTSDSHTWRMGLGILVIGLVSTILEMIEKGVKHSKTQRDEHDAAVRKAEETRKREELFLRYLFSMLAKMAKADGHIDAQEVKTAEKVFAQFEFASQRRQFCSDVFNLAKDDPMTIYWYAEQFSRLVTDTEVCVFVYELLWDIACADGWLHPAEKSMLRNLCRFLGIRDTLYDISYYRRTGSYIEGDKDAIKEASPKGTKHKLHSPYVSGKSSILDAYVILECEPMVTDEELKAAYRRMAKRYHPDLLRANGVPEEMITMATEEMAQVNAAWEDIRRVRGIA